MQGILSHYACVNSSVPANSREICLSSLSAEPITHSIGNLKSRDDILTDTLAELQFPCYNLITLDKIQSFCLHSLYITSEQHQQQEELKAMLPHTQILAQIPPQHSCTSHTVTFTNILTVFDCTPSPLQLKKKKKKRSGVFTAQLQSRILGCNCRVLLKLSQPSSLVIPEPVLLRFAPHPSLENAT